MLNVTSNVMYSAVGLRGGCCKKKRQNVFLFSCLYSLQSDLHAVSSLFIPNTFGQNSLMMSGAEKSQNSTTNYSREELQFKSEIQSDSHTHRGVSSTLSRKGCTQQRRTFPAFITLLSFGIKHHRRECCAAY